MKDKRSFDLERKGTILIPVPSPADSAETRSTLCLFIHIFQTSFIIKVVCYYIQIFRLSQKFPRPPLWQQSLFCPHSRLKSVPLLLGFCPVDLSLHALGEDVRMDEQAHSGVLFCHVGVLLTEAYSGSPPENLLSLNLDYNVTMSCDCIRMV